MKNLLIKAGLTGTEAELYLAGIGDTSTSVSELVKKTGINRTTIYHALETLKQKGMASESKSEGRLDFVMAKPSSIKNFLQSKIDQLQTKQKLIDQIVPELEAKIAMDKSQTMAVKYEGVAGVKMVIEEALYSRNRRWDLIAPAKNFFSDFDKSYAKYFMDTRRERGIIARTLWEHTVNRRVLTENEIKERNPRILPDEYKGSFKSVMILFDDKAAFISSFKEKTGVLIQSNEMYQTMKVLFENAWVNAKPYKKSE